MVRMRFICFTRSTSRFGKATGLFEDQVFESNIAALPFCRAFGEINKKGRISWCEPVHEMCDLPKFMVDFVVMSKSTSETTHNTCYGNLHIT